MNLRKFLLSIAALVLILAAGAAYVLPSVIENQITSKLQERIEGEAPADSLQVNITSSPQFMLLTGRVDELNISADNVQMGDVMLSSLNVQGRSLDISIEDLLLARRLVIDSADELTVRASVSQEALAELLRRKVDGVSDISVQITPEAVNASGRISVFGHTGDIRIKGKIIIEDRQLKLRLSDLSTTSGLFGRIGISFTKDILIADSASLPIANAQFKSVEQQDGQVIIEADVDNNIGAVNQ